MEALRLRPDSMRWLGQPRKTVNDISLSLLLLTKHIMHLCYSFLFLQNIAIGHVSCSKIKTCIYILFLLEYNLYIWKDSLLSNCSSELIGITNKSKKNTMRLGAICKGQRGWAEGEDGEEECFNWGGE